MPLFSQEEIDAARAKALAPPPAAPEESTKPARMVGADGKIYNVPAASVGQAIKSGWKPATFEDVAKEREIRHGVEYAEEHRVSEGIKRFGNEAALGAFELHRNLTASPDELAVEHAVKEQSEAAHPIESSLEKAAGFIAPMFLPGIGAAGEAVGNVVQGGTRVAEATAAHAAEASLVRKMGAQAAKFATEGAIYSTPQAAVQAAYGDPDQAAETMLWGIGLSGALGAGSAALGAGVKAGAKALKSGAKAAIGSYAESLSRPQANGITAVDDIARNVLGITDKQANKLGPARLSRIVERADQEGLLAANPKERPGLIRSMLADAGDKIGEHHTKLEALLEDSELKTHGPVPTKVAAQFSEEVLGKHPELMSELHSSNFKWWQKVDSEIRAAGSEPSFDALQQARKNISASVKDFAADSVPAKIVRLADSVIKTNLEESAQRLYTAGELPEQFGDYLAQKERYEAGKALIKNVNEFKGTGRMPGGLGGFGFKDIAQVGVGAMGGPLGLMAAGANIAREHAMKKFLANEGGLLGKSVSYLRKVAEDPATAPFLGGFLAKEGVSSLTRHIDAIPGYLSGAQAVTRSTTGAVARIIGPTTGLTKDQQYERLVDHLHQAAADPSLAANNVGQVASAFTGTSAHLAAMVAQKKLAAVGYLQSQVPKDPNPPTPFQRGPAWKPSEAQKADLLRKVDVVSNPMSVWDHFQQGTMGKADREACQAVYPTTYKAMCTKILETAYDPNGPHLDHAKRIQLSMFTGLPLDPSLKRLSSIQQALSAPTDQGQGGQPQAGPRPSSRPKLKGPGLSTDSQRRTYGGSVK